MHLYRLTVQLRGTLVTPLAADTLFGHWCWFVRQTRGEDALGDAIAAFCDGTPPFRLSSGFSRRCAGNGVKLPMLPIPVWPDLIRHRDKEDAQLMRNGLAPFETITGPGLNNERVRQALRELPSPVPGTVLKHMHGAKASPVRESGSLLRIRNTVNRNSGGTLSAQGYFEQSVIGAEPNTQYDIYFDVPPADSERLRRDFGALLSQGYGQDASTGAGFFDPVAWERVEVAEEEANAWLALSPFVPSPADPQDLRYSLATKYGKLGGHWAFARYNQRIPWKKPIIMMQPGALSLTAPPSGVMLKSVHETLPVVHYGLCLSIPIHYQRSA